MPENLTDKPEVKVQNNPNPTENDSRKANDLFDAKSYAAALKKQREASVPKEVYENLKHEHETLVQEMMEGKSSIQVDTSKPEKVATKDLVKKILNDRNMSNIEYVGTALKIREQMLEEGKPDPFAPLGFKRATTREEAETADRVAKHLQECVDKANGDDNVFNELLRLKLR